MSAASERKSEMIQIRPISDLRNKFNEIENIVNDGEPVYLTKNGYGSMVVMSLELFSELTGGKDLPDGANRKGAKAKKSALSE